MHIVLLNKGDTWRVAKTNKKRFLTYINWSQVVGGWVGWGIGVYITNYISDREVRRLFWGLAVQFCHVEEMEFWE